MKSAVVLYVLAALVYSAYCIDEKEFAQVIEKCKTETGFKGIPKDIKTEGASKEEKCFLRCVAESKELMKKDGTIDMDAVKAAANMDKKIPTELKDKYIKVLEECSKEVKPDPSDLCETAYKYFSCKMEKLYPK